MIVGTTTMLRAGTTCSYALKQPILLRTTTTVAAPAAATYSTFPVAAFSARSRLLSAPPQPAKPSSILFLHQQHSPATPSARRQASSSSSSAAAAADPTTPALDWNTFFQLRKTRRRWQVGFSVVTSAIGGFGGALLCSTGLADPLTSQVPLDPFFTMIMVTVGCTALGWLVGPSLGSAVFYVIKRKYKGPMTLKESQFFARIKKNRVDPSTSSAGNPVPDFYGEKISSVKGYRQWLKDQRAYNKKRTTFI